MVASLFTAYQAVIRHATQESPAIENNRANHGACTGTVALKDWPGRGTVLQ